MIHKLSLQFLKEKEITRQIVAAYWKPAITHKIDCEMFVFCYWVTTPLPCFKFNPTYTENKNGNKKIEQ